MARFHEAWLEYQRKRWMRPDAYRYWRSDADRWVKPETLRPLGRPLRDSSQTKSDQLSVEDDAAVQAQRELLLDLKAEVTAILARLRLERVLRDFKAGFNPNQPRVPAGSPDGGQWTSDGSGSGGIGSETSRSGATDFSGQRRSRADGHHHVPRGLHEKLPLSPETRKVFEEGKTGPQYDSRSNKYDSPHREYNEAVANLFDQFVARNGIQIERMTPDQAQSFLGEVLASQDPRIRNYNMLIQMREIMQRIFRRPGRPE